MSEADGPAWRMAGLLATRLTSRRSFVAVGRTSSAYTGSKQFGSAGARGLGWEAWLSA